MILNWFFLKNNLNKTNESSNNDNVKNTTNDKTSDNLSINSPIEDTEISSPLQELLFYNFTLDVLIVLSLLLIVYILSYKYIKLFFT